MSILKVTSVNALDGFKLDLAFSDTSGVADLSGDLTGPLVGLQDRDVWSRAHLRRGVVTWSDELISRPSSCTPVPTTSKPRRPSP